MDALTTTHSASFPSPRSVRLADLAALVQGEVIGEPLTEIDGAVPLYEVSPGRISLLDAPSLPAWVDASQLTALVVRHPHADLNIPQLVVDSPHDAFAAIVRHFLPAMLHDRRGVSPAAHIDPTAKIGADCWIAPGVVVGPHVVIGDRCEVHPGVVLMDHTTVGDDCVLFPTVTLYERTQIGRRVTIHAGSVLGAYGFGYQTREGTHQRTAQLGHVVIEDDVELGACVTIDRGTYGSTRIGRGTKIDNQVMIGHNCQIGRHNLLCSQVGIAGSCRTGDYVVLAGQVGLKDHITLGDRVIVGAQAGVMDDLPGGEVYLGSPATPQREQMQIMAVQRRLPEMRRALKQLQKLIENQPSNNAEHADSMPARDERAA